MIVFPYEKPDLARQRRALVAYAEAGDTRAQRVLADHYRIGDELTPPDYTNAIRWYRRAAEQGDAAAQCDLGSMYLNGFGVAQDAVEAARWQRKAADQGLATAQFNLALRYLHGEGVDNDDAAAVEWLIRAALQSHIEATGQLGTLFLLGRGVERDVAAASGMLVNAARAGDIVSVGNLATSLLDIEHEALTGSVRAAISLVWCFSEGLGVETNLVTAFAWLRWGQAYGTRDDDPHVRVDEYNLWLEYEVSLTEAQRDQSHALVTQMRLRSEAL